MQTRCARLARSPVLGVRPSALIRYRVPGPRCQVPGTWYLTPTPHFPHQILTKPYQLRRP